MSDSLPRTGAKVTHLAQSRATKRRPATGDDEQLRATVAQVIATEAKAIEALLNKVDSSVVSACRLILACQGRVVVTGMGKSGHIARKIAATFASAGTPAFFMHPGEASHGDIGMITPTDIVLALSNSGETEEILTIVPLIKRLGVSLIALSGNPNSSLAHAASIHIDVGVDREACPLGLAPTASTTAALAMGDALAIALLEARGFDAEDFARSHPGGRLGRRLLLHIDDVMHQGDAVPEVRSDASIQAALVEMTAKSLGMTVVVSDDRQVVGVYTDGDLRRTLDRGLDIKSTPIGEVMTPSCICIRRGTLAADAVSLLQAHAISALPVVDEDERLVGALNMHDLFRAGVL